MNESDFNELLKCLLVPEVEHFNELNKVINKYNSGAGLAAAICAILHTWCEEHNVDPVDFFDKMFTVVSQQVAEERESGLL